LKALIIAAVIGISLISGCIQTQETTTGDITTITTPITQTTIKENEGKTITTEKTPLYQKLTYEDGNSIGILTKNLITNEITSNYEIQLDLSFVDDPIVISSKKDYVQGDFGIKFLCSLVSLIFDHEQLRDNLEKSESEISTEYEGGTVEKTDTTALEFLENGNLVKIETTIIEEGTGTKIAECISTGIGAENLTIYYFGEFK